MFVDQRALELNHRGSLLHRASGFTIVELMVTLAIMAVLVTVAVPLMQVAVQRQKERELRSALIEIREGIDAYRRATAQGRIATNLGESGYPRTLNDLVRGLPDQRSPNRQMIYFLRRLPADPMSAMAPEEAAAEPESTWGIRSYASAPDDPQEGDDVFDVYSRSEKTGLNGVPYRRW